MTQEEIKQTWEEAARKLYCPTPAEFEDMYRAKKETALESLARRYRRFSILGIVMVLCSFGWMQTAHFIPEMEMRWKVTVVMMLYFACCAIIDNWLYRGVSSIDCFTMSVSQVAEKALYYRKKHLQSMIVLLPFAVLVVGLMAYSLHANEYMLYGMAAGAVCGLLMGYIQFREFMKEYNLLIKE
ncbi:MAG: hypothetical protein K2G90_01660 [Muribaculaceae bacterium]|nr:hypothetical protein [Muribaculaceae bacterium]